MNRFLCPPPTWERGQRLNTFSSSKIPNEIRTQKEKSIRKQKLSQKEIDNSPWNRKTRSTCGEAGGEAGGGAVVHGVWCTTPISAIAKQINQIPTVLHQVLSLSFSSLISMQKKIKNWSTQIKQKEPNTHMKQKWPRWKVHSCILPSCGSVTKWQRSG